MLDHKDSKSESPKVTARGVGVGTGLAGLLTTALYLFSNSPEEPEQLYSTPIEYNGDLREPSLIDLSEASLPPPERKQVFTFEYKDLLRPGYVSGPDGLGTHPFWTLAEYQGSDTDGTTDLRENFPYATLRTAHRVELRARAYPVDSILGTETVLSPFTVDLDPKLDFHLRQYNPTLPLTIETKRISLSEWRAKESTGEWKHPEPSPVCNLYLISSLNTAELVQDWLKQARLMVEAGRLQDLFINPVSNLKASSIASEITAPIPVAVASTVPSMPTPSFASHYSYLYSAASFCQIIQSLDDPRSVQLDFDSVIAAMNWRELVQLVDKSAWRIDFELEVQCEPEGPISIYRAFDRTLGVDYLTNYRYVDTLEVRSGEEIENSIRHGF